MVSAHGDLGRRAGLGAQRETPQCLGESQSARMGLNQPCSAVRQGTTQEGQPCSSKLQRDVPAQPAAAQGAGARTRGVGEVGRIEGRCWGLGGEVGTLVWLSATHPPLSLLRNPGCLGAGVLRAVGGVGSI